MSGRSIILVAGCGALLFFAGCTGATPLGDVGSGGHGPHLPFKHIPDRPTHLNNSTVVSYARQYENVRSYNATVEQFSKSPENLTNVSLTIKSRLLTRTAQGYYVETATNIATTSESSGHTNAGNQGIPSPSIYYITENETQRIPLPQIYPSNSTLSVAAINYTVSRRKPTTLVVG